MTNYNSPKIIRNEELAEGVYLASGDVAQVDGADGGCESKYMKGVWMSTSHKGMGGPNIKDIGCAGCFAHTGHGCKLAMGEPKKPGKRYMPEWEAKGEPPEEHGVY